MTPAAVQRWRDRRGAYRPAGEPIATSSYEVAPIADDTTAKAFVERHHYSGSYPAARHRVGLYRGAELVGIAVFSHPPNEAVLRRLPCERMAGVELGRFVLLDDVPGNGESWFLARAFEHLRSEGIECLISHSDPQPRRTAGGELVLPGHVGTIYQATNAVYAGRTKARPLRLLPDGTVFSERAMSKIRSRERGWRYSVAQLVAAGATPPAADIMPAADLAAWLALELPRVTRRVKHHGNHRYLWALDRKLRRAVAELAARDDEDALIPYPKAIDQEAA